MKVWFQEYYGEDWQFCQVIMLCPTEKGGKDLALSSAVLVEIKVFVPRVR